jgi:hypothetical protein
MDMSREQRELAGTPSDVDENQRFYDRLWGDVRLRPPPRFNTWPLLAPLAAVAPRRLEIGAGMRPRLPLPGTHFIDISRPALRALRAAEGVPAAADEPPAAPGPNPAMAPAPIEAAPAPAAVALPVAVVDARRAPVLLSVPLYMHAWTFFDDLVITAAATSRTLATLLAAHGLVLERSAPTACSRGHVPPALRHVVARHHREHAMRMYDRIIMPLALRAASPRARPRPAGRSARRRGRALLPPRRPLS